MTATSELTRSRFSTPRGIKYALTKGPDFQREAHGKTTAEATYRVYGRQVLDFIDEMLPLPFIRDGKIIQPQITRIRNTVSQAGGGYLSAARISSVAMAEPDGIGIIDPFKLDTNADSLTNGHQTYSRYALVTIQYESNIDAAWSGDRTNKDDPVRFLDMTVGANFEFYSIKSNSNLLGASPELSVSAGAAVATPIKDLTAPVVYLRPLVEHTGHWAWAVNPNFGKIWEQLGSVNSKKLSYIKDAEPETVMFMGIAGRQEYRHAGNSRTLRTWALDFRFLQRQIRAPAIVNGLESTVLCGWNHTYDASTQSFIRLYRRPSPNASRVPLYRLSDFSDLYETGP